MGNKVSRWLRNYDAERRALQLLSRRSDAAGQPDRAPRFAAEQQLLRRVAADPALEAAVKQKDSRLLGHLSRVKVVSSSPAPSPVATSDRPLPQRRHYQPMGDLGVPEIAPETVPAGRLTLQQFQDLLNTREPVGQLSSAAAEELLALYSPLVQRSRTELRQMLREGEGEKVEESAAKK